MKYLTGIAVLAVAVAFGADSSKPGKFVINPPTLICLGFEWEIEGDDNWNASCQVQYRPSAGGDWQTALPLHRTTYKVDSIPILAGSIFDLQPGTEYEVKLTLTDPDGVEGEAVNTVKLRTRAAPVMPKGTTWHVYPPDYKGQRAEPSFATLREALCSDAAAGKVQPGDTIALHAGAYATEHKVYKGKAEKAVKETVINIGTPPTVPADGEVRHVYPAGYKGKKQEPSFVGIGYAFLGKNKAFSNGKPATPGTVFMVHAGVYKNNRYDYRNAYAQANGEGVLRLGKHGGILDFSGTNDKPYVIKAAGDGEVLFDGDGCFNLFDLRGTKNLWIDGITVANTDVAFYTERKDLPGSAAENLAITNCRIMDVNVPVWVNGEETGLGADWDGTYYVKLKGTAEKPIVIKATGDGEVVIDGQQSFSIFDFLAAEHLWFDGLTIKGADGAILGGGNYRGGEGFGRCDGLIVTNCTIDDVRYGILCTNPDAKGYYVADNRVVGRMTGRYSIGNYAAPFGVSLGGQGHTVCYNHIEGFHDALDTAWTRVNDRKNNRYTAALDFYNNLFYHGDDFVEADAGTTNIRIMRNRCFNCLAVALSNQGVTMGPYYWIRNVAVNTSKDGGAAFKNPGGVIGVIAYHNTILAHNAFNLSMTASDYRNNIFCGAANEDKRGKGRTVLMAKDNHNIHDYNALREVPGGIFQIDRKKFNSFAELQKNTPFEHNGMLISGYDIFRKCFDLNKKEGMKPYKKTEVYMPDDFDLRVKEGTKTIDAGCVLPNVNDKFTGNAPDLGAYEAGEPLPHYGPRNSVRSKK